MPAFFLIFLMYAQSLPDGKGKEIVQKTCGGPCHDVDVIMNERLSRQGWTNVVDTMVSRGATGTDEEIAAVIDYLTAHFGRPSPKINVNTESAAQLAKDLGLTDKESQAIVDYREKNGKFTSWTDLEKVPSLDLKKIEPQKDRIVF